jgi:hypothetical protein
MDRAWFGAIADGDTPRVYELAGYRFEQRFVGPESFTLAAEAPRRRDRLVRSRSSRPALAHYRQRGHGFDARVLDLPDDTYLDGWWQDERYFLEIRSILLDELELRSPVTGRDAGLLRRIRDGVSVSVHVRRGDYVSNPASRAFHGLLDVAYYEAALGRLAELSGTSGLGVFVFSDDIEWCRENLRLGSAATFVDSGNSGAEDMRLMKNCRHHVVANSSFSWWGAWLSDHPEKIVVAPRKWFGDAEADAQTEIVPRSWLRL